MTIVKTCLNIIFIFLESNNFNVSMLRQQRFLSKMLERLSSEKGRVEVMTEIEDVRSILTSNKNMVLYMAANVDKLTNQVSDVYEPWKEFAVTHSSTQSKYG